MCCSCFIFELHQCKTKNFNPWSQIHNNWHIIWHTFQ